MPFVATKTESGKRKGKRERSREDREEDENEEENNKKKDKALSGSYTKKEKVRSPQNGIRPSIATEIESEKRQRRGEQRDHCCCLIFFKKLHKRGTRFKISTKIVHSPDRNFTMGVVRFEPLSIGRAKVNVKISKGMVMVPLTVVILSPEEEVI